MCRPGTKVRRCMESVVASYITAQVDVRRGKRKVSLLEVELFTTTGRPKDIAPLLECGMSRGGQRIFDQRCRVKRGVRGNSRESRGNRHSVSAGCRDRHLNSYVVETDPSSTQRLFTPEEVSPCVTPQAIFCTWPAAPATELVEGIEDKCPGLRANKSRPRTSRT